MSVVTRFSLALAFSLVPGALLAQNYTFQTFAFPTTLKHSGTDAWSINDVGDVVGTFGFNPEGGPHVRYRGFLRLSDGSFAPLIIDPDESQHMTFATAINDAGTIGGYYMGSDVNYHGYIDVAGTFTTVDALTGPSTEINGINNSGDFVGGTGTYPQNGDGLHGFLSHGGVITQIDVPGVPTGTTAYGIDDTGTIVGCAGIGFIRDPLGNFHTFSVAHSGITCPTGIQTSIGTIVGYFEEKSGYVHGFVYKYPPGTSSPDPASQGTLIVFDYPDAYQTVPGGVNKQGQISGWASPRKGRVSVVSFIATPVAEPTAAAPAP